MFRTLKSTSFNIEDSHLMNIDRIGKLLFLVMIAFLWCYNVGEYVLRNIKEIKVKNHGRKARYLFDVNSINPYSQPYYTLNRHLVWGFYTLPCDQVNR